MASLAVVRRRRAAEWSSTADRTFVASRARNRIGNDRTNRTIATCLAQSSRDRQIRSRAVHTRRALAAVAGECSLQVRIEGTLRTRRWGCGASKTVAAAWARSGCWIHSSRIRLRSAGRTNVTGITYTRWCSRDWTGAVVTAGTRGALRRSCQTVLSRIGTRKTRCRNAGVPRTEVTGCAQILSAVRHALEWAVVARRTALTSRLCSVRIE